MNWSRKVQKFFSREGFESIREHARRWTHPVNPKKILNTLDPMKVAEFRAHYPEGPNSPRYYHFADVHYWIGVNVERGQDLWLDRAPPLRILDLGCGVGYFLYVCRYFGHDVLGLDVGDRQLFNDGLALLNVPRVMARIEANVPLPSLEQKFDLVTAHRLVFDRIGDPNAMNRWRPEHWKFFLEDVRSRILTPDGRLLLDFNPRPDRTFFSPELHEFFLSEGARIFRSKALFSRDRNRRPRF
jgi:SAM-dependent methyltransferase